MSSTRKTIITTTTWMAGVASLLVVLILPLSYLASSYQYLSGSLASEAEINSRIVTDLINANPFMWRFEQMRLEELLGKRPDTGISETRRIVDLQGKVIAESGEPLPPPQLTVTHDVLDAGLAVGRLEISRSLRPLLLHTCLIALGGFVLGLLLYLTLRILPLRAVREAEKALRDTSEFLTRIMQSTTNAILVITPEGLVSHVNQRGLEISGYSGAELLGHPFALLFPTGEYPVIREQLESLLQQKVPVLGREITWKCRDGKLVTLSWGGAPLLREDGVVGTVFTAEDISQRKRDLAEKEKLIDKLQNALTEIQTLRGIIPICSYCKKIRTEQGVWNQIEAYIHAHSGAEFSHGVCPDCYAKLTEDLDEEESP